MKHHDILGNPRIIVIIFTHKGNLRTGKSINIVGKKIEITSREIMLRDARIQSTRLCNKAKEQECRNRQTNQI